MYAPRTGDWEDEQLHMLTQWKSSNDYPASFTASRGASLSGLDRTARLTSLQSDLPVYTNRTDSHENSQLPTPPSSCFDPPAQTSDLSQGSTLVLHGSPSSRVAPLKRNNHALDNQKRERRTQPDQNDNSLRRPRTGRIKRASKSTNAGSSLISRGKTASSFVRTLQRELYASSVDSAAGQDLVNRNDAAQMGTIVTSSPRSIAGYQQPVLPDFVVDEGCRSVEYVVESSPSESRAPECGLDSSLLANRYWRHGRLALWISLSMPFYNTNVAVLTKCLQLSANWRNWVVDANHLSRFSEWAHDKVFGAAQTIRYICPDCYSVYGIFMEQDVEHVLFLHPQLTV
jgi:hypothetical protein